MSVDPADASQKCNNPYDHCYFDANESAIQFQAGYCVTQPAPSGCIQYAGTPSSPDAVQCMASCLVTRLTLLTGSSMSSQCAECLQPVMTCQMAFCLNECLPDPTSAACLGCMCQVHTDTSGFVGNCLQDAFAKCAGFRPSSAEVGCP